MQKLLRSIKVFGRCRVQGHGGNCNCEVNNEIQTTAITRAKEKADLRKEIKQQMED